MLERNKRCSRIRWSSLRLSNSAAMSNCVCQRQLVRRYWLGAKQCRRIMLDS